MVPRAGAIIEDDTDEMKMYAETIKIAIHFFVGDQFFGFLGSW
jgi:hypothetical protein